MDNKIIELEVKDGKTKKPSIFKRIRRKICGFWMAIKDYVLAVLFYIGIVFVSILPYIIAIIIGKKYDEKAEKIYTDDDGNAFVVDRWMTGKEQAKYYVRWKKGIKTEEIFDDLGIKIKEKIQ